MARNKHSPELRQPQKGSNAWTDLALTLPIFVGYHLGVVFLPVRNAADIVTRELTALADQNLMAYSALTLALGGLYVAILMMLGRGDILRWSRFVLLAIEGVVYAIAMRIIANFVVGSLFLGPFDDSPLAGLVMSLGAGFYEEIGFRVLLFGMGAKVLSLIFPETPKPLALLRTLLWALAAAALFSAWHYVGEMGDAFDLKSFVFRWVAGLVFTLIYAFRGLAPAVWTHALYDIWVLVF